VTSPELAAAIAADTRVIARSHPHPALIHAGTVLEEVDVQSTDMIEILVELESDLGGAVVTDDLSSVRTVADLAAVPRIPI
jgi:acyl carrier protein